MLRTLRKTIILCLGLILPLLSYSQERKDLKLLISELEQRFEVKFSYSDADLNGSEIITPEAASFDEYIAQIVAQTQLQVKKLSERYYAISKPNMVSICGQVLDNYAENNIPGATVEVLGTEEAIVTDIDGNFQLTDISRTASLRIRFLGYVTRIIAVEELISPSCSKLLLAERREQLNEVVVYQFLTSGIVKEKDASVTLNTAELGILPGLIEPDILQTVQALPGIKSIDETVSEINVRGGTNDQNLILWNGIKIYQSGHFFGLISAFNPYLIKDVSVYKNGTPAHFGDGVSSVISMNTNNELNGYFTGGGGLNFITGDVFGQFPIKDNLELQFSARRSTTDFLNTSTYNSFKERVFQDTDVRDFQNQTINTDFQREEDFFFYDYSGKLLYDLNEDHKLRFSFIGMANDLKYRETNLTENTTTQSFLVQNNLSIGLQWNAQWNTRFSTNANIYFSNYDLDALGISTNQVQQLFQRNKVDERAVKLNSNFSISDTFNWKNGFDYIETGITNISDVTQPPFQSNITSVIRKYAPHTQFTYTSFEERFIATVGVRANYMVNLASFGADFNKILVEPRLNLNFRVSKNLRAQVLGEFKSQTTNQIIDLEQNFLGVEKRRWILSDDNLLPITQSKQGSLGFNYDTNGLYVGLEGFYKQVDGISVLTQGFQNEGQFDGDEIGSYEVMGLEFLVNKKGNNYSTWLSYTFNKNDYTFKDILEESFPNNLDVRHSLTLATTVDIKRLKLALGVNYRTGKPYTEPNADDPLNTNPFPAQINYDAPNDSRLPRYFRADASATYGFDLNRTFKANAGISLLNLTDRENILNKYYRVNANNEIETVENKSLGLTPNVSFRVSF